MHVSSYLQARLRFASLHMRWSVVACYSMAVDKPRRFLGRKPHCGYETGYRKCNPKAGSALYNSRVVRCMEVISIKYLGIQLLL